MKPDLDAVAARAKAATPGPWHKGSPRFWCVLDHGRGPAGHGQGDCVYTFHGWSDSDCDAPYDIHRDPPYSLGDVEQDTEVIGAVDYDTVGVLKAVDADFIAHARTDIPDLLAVARRAEDLEKLRDIIDGEWPSDWYVRAPDGFVEAVSRWLLEGEDG